MNAQIQQIKNDMTPSKADSRSGAGNEAGASQNLKQLDVNSNDDYENDLKEIDIEEQ